VQYEERYIIDEKHKTPAFLDHLVGIGQIFGIQPGGGAENVARQVDMWYAFRLDIKYVPADIQITPVMAIQSGTVQDTSNPQQPKADQPRQPNSPTPLGAPPVEVPPAGSPPSPPPPAAAPSATPATPTSAAPVDSKAESPAEKQPANPGASPGARTLSANNVTLDAKTFDNEGKYHIDFSVAVPITKISELSYVQTSQGIAPANVDKQKIFALFDFIRFPWTSRIRFFPSIRIF
jgi:hypothetical protein